MSPPLGGLESVQHVTDLSGYIRFECCVPLSHSFLSIDWMSYDGSSVCECAGMDARAYKFPLRTRDCLESVEVVHSEQRNRSIIGHMNHGHMGICAVFFNPLILLPVELS